MKKLPLFIVLLVLVLATIYILFIKPGLDGRTSSVVPVSVESEEYNFAFSYPSGEEAYVLIEPVIPPTTSDGLKKVSIIMNNQDYMDYHSSAGEIDTPPTVSIFVVKETKYSDSEDDRLTRLKKWASQNSRYTSYTNKISELEEVGIDGIKAFRYHTSGYYQQEVYLVSHRGNIYVFVGQYEKTSDNIFDMFQNLINGIVFY
jgi:hypothetical protein